MPYAKDNRIGETQSAGLGSIRVTAFPFASTDAIGSGRSIKPDWENGTAFCPNCIPIRPRRAGTFLSLSVMLSLHRIEN
jgi:hypothetical protein